MNAMHANFGERSKLGTKKSHGKEMLKVSFLKYQENLNVKKEVEFCSKYASLFHF